MATKLNVEIVTPERRLAQLAADEVIAPGAEDKVFTVSEGLHPRDLRQPPYDDGLPGSLRTDAGDETDDKKNKDGGERK